MVRNLLADMTLIYNVLLKRDTMTNNEVKFLHYRHFDKQGVVESKRGATVAYRLFPDGSLRFAIAGVHHKDNYSRREGRKVSTLRLSTLDAQSFYCAPMTNDQTSYERVEDFRRYMDTMMHNTRGYLRRRRAR